MPQLPPPDQQSIITVLCQGARAGGEPFWAYVEMKPTRVKAFLDAQQNGQSFDLEDFGTIVKWGIGADVPDDIKEHMEREHGVNHNFQEDMLRKLKEIRE